MRGAIAPPAPKRARKIFLNVSENKSSCIQKAIFYILVFTKTTIARNALIPQLLGDFAHRPSAGTLPPAHPLGAQPPDPRFARPPARTSGPF